MASKAVKRPVYDGNTCLLYDYMVLQGLTEEEVARLMGVDKQQIAIMGEELYNLAPWQPVARWLMRPDSIPNDCIYLLCRVLHAPIEACYAKSRVLNGQEFHMGHMYKTMKEILAEATSEALVQELEGRGYRVIKEGYDGTETNEGSGQPVLPGEAGSCPIQ
jgi:hypothetical protein